MPLLWLTKQEYRALQQVVFETFIRNDAPGYLVGFRERLLRQFGIARNEVEFLLERQRVKSYLEDYIGRLKRGEKMVIPPPPSPPPSWLNPGKQMKT